MVKSKRLLKSVLGFSLAIVMLVVSMPISVHAASNAETIFKFLKNQMGLNSAAACGVLANIEKESSFNPNVYGDSGTSYGICQWHGARFTALRNWCGANGHDYTTLSGQLNYLKFELSANNSTYLWNGKTIYNKLASVSNTADGAYQAGYDWCYYYEVPANKEVRAQERGNLARNSYWPRYGDGTPAPTILQTVNCKYTITVAANSGKLPLYTTATTQTASSTNALKNNAQAYNVYCTQKVVLSDGTTRYFFKDADGNNFYMKWNSNIMTVVQKHNWGSWSLQAATCQKNGLWERSCTCGAKETEVLPKLDHSYGSWQTVKKADCTTAGQKKRTCSCGVYQIASIAALGHEPSGEWTVDEMAVDDYSGSKSHHCTRCSAKMDVTTIPAPASNKLTAGNGDSGVTLKWTKDANADRYRLYRSVYEDGKWSDWRYWDVTRTPIISDVEAENGRLYRHRVAFVDADGNQYACITSNPILRLTNRKLSVSNGESGVVLKWTAVKQAAKYRTYRSVYTNGKWSDWEYWDVTKTPLISDVYAKSGTIYRYQVRVQNSENTTIATLTSGSICRLVSPKVTASNTANGVKVSWGKVKGASSYAVYRSYQNEGSWSGWVRFKTTTATSWTDATAKSGIKYRYMVRAVKEEDMSLATTGAVLTRLNAPTVTATNKENAVKVSWGKAKGASSYAVYRSYYIDGKWSKWARFKTTTATSWMDTTAKNGVKYRYMVRAIKNDDMSVATTGDILTRLVTPTTGVTKVSKGIKVSWNKNGAAKQYYVYRSYYADGKWSKWVKMKTASSASWTDTIAKKGVTYRYMARTVKNGDLSYYKVSSGIKR